ncbi:MAG: PKD domain-containing protein [Verrucomicrobiota bacterium]
MKKLLKLYLLTCFCLVSPLFSKENTSSLLRAVDLDIGEIVKIKLSDGSPVTLKLLAIKESSDTMSKAVRRAEVAVEVNGERVDLISATYHLPTTAAGVQIDCPITQGYVANSGSDAWGLKKAARLRLWPAGSPWVKPGTFQYPAKQRWFATLTQMANEPTFADGGDQPSRKKIYYHYGLDIGGAEGLIDIVAATAGQVVSLGEQVMPEHKDSPAHPRYDVVYVLDDRGWYYRYSHLNSIDPALTLGQRIKIGSAIGVLGKEGGSGGWTHLHFGIKSMQPSGEWGTQEGYAFLWQSYINEHRPKVLAVARPHHFVKVGEPVQLDGSKSWTANAADKKYQWTFHDGTTSNQPRVKRSYQKAGVYSEILKVSDSDGASDYDFNIVQVIDAQHPEQLPPTIHATYAPTFGIKAGDEVTFKVRSFRTTTPGEIWNFGDGSPEKHVQSDGNAVKLAKNGYAVSKHRFATAGHYIVSVRHTNEHGFTATQHLQVRVAE